MINKSIQVVVLMLFAVNSDARAQAGQLDWSGYMSLEPRVFLDDPLFSEQPDAGLSMSAVIAPEFRLDWSEGQNRFTFSPFVRLDADDDERTHWDIREAYWQHARGPWTWQVGISRVFWGVTESRHLVDIVNQTDWVEDIDEEDKLGQPMVSVERWIAKAGSFVVFLLPGFRERTFSADDARLRGPLPIATDAAEFESKADKRRIDWAGRWSHSLGKWDVGLSAFHGTGREPLLLPRVDDSGRAVLVPRYQIIGQFGIDIQYTRDAWLWKLEALRRSGHGKTFGAYVAGVEYTLFNLGDSGADLGLLGEYLYDGRDNTAPPTFYDDDWFMGLRLALNDTEDTTLLGGAIIGDSGTFAIVEAERRLGEAWKLELELRLIADVDPTDPYLSGFQNDSFVTLRIARYL
ncbi:MAG: hypothetical protein GTO41_03710 [Burkholderiales bacterium]|nr:hypothetical protein [Burkholderiales bacterium]